MSSLTYTTNWWYIFDSRSYFEVIGRPPMLQHLWSLALEEQFYLIWPTVLLLVWRPWGRRGVGITALIGAVASTIWMATLAVHEHIPALTDTARVYFGSDTHAMTVMVGAALAVVWRPSRLPTFVPKSAQVFLTTVGIVSMLVMGWFFLWLPDTSTWLYRGGFLVFAIVTAGLVMAASHPASQFGRGLGNRVLRWLGTRSYGIYLWHWPIFLVTRPTIDLPYSGWAAALTSLALTGVCAEASYRWVEMPIRRGALGASWRRLRAGDSHTRFRWIGVGVASAATLVVGGVALAQVPIVDSSTYLGGVTSVGAGTLGPKKDDNENTQHPGRGGGKDHQHQSVPLSQRRVTVVGDSVALSARNAIIDRLPNAHFDAEVGRQPYDAIARIRQRLKFDKLAPLLVIQTGTNGIPVEEDLRELLVDLDDIEGIVLVNVRAQIPWMDQSNTAIDKATRGLKNVVVVNWAGLSKDRGGYFVADGTHLTYSGAAAYARGVVDGLRQVEQLAKDREKPTN